MSIRTERVARLVQREVADILNSEYGDQVQPLVTVTNARVTPDLSIAYVYVSVLGETQAAREAAFRQIEGIADQVRHSLASRIRHQLRTVPELRFFLDETQQKAQKMDDLFDRIRAERERRGAE